MRQRWIVISNCQSFGLANSIEALARDVECAACDNWSFQRAVAADPDHFRDYDFALILPEAKDWPGFDAARLPPTMEVPAFQFAAYHPDSVYVFADGTMFLDGVIAAYQSMIALAAYKEALSPERAATFFNATIYQSAGYFGQWEMQRDWLVGLYRDAGLEIGASLLRRSRGQAFMHTVNHPRIGILFDLARAILDKLGQPVFAEVPLPPDNLAATAWPIYPEVGERLGLAGAYLFKPAEKHKPLDLVHYLAESFRRFAPWDKSQLRVIKPLEPALKRIRRHMREAA